MVKKPSVFLLIFIVLGVACNDASEGTGKALVNLLLIDAPGDFDEAWIEVRGVEILQGRNRESNDAHWLLIEYEQPNRQVDIAKLVGGGTLLLGRAELPITPISKIRLILGEEHHLIKNGKTRSLTLKDPSESAIEINVDYPLEPSLSYDIYLDFDLERSVQSTSDSTEFVLFPVVRSFVRQETSEIEGKIRPTDAKSVLYAIQGTDTVTTLTDARGQFSFKGLKEGKHTLLIQSRKPYLDTLFTVSTAIGKSTVLEEIILKIPASN